MAIPPKQCGLNHGEGPWRHERTAETGAKSAIGGGLELAPKKSFFNCPTSVAPWRKDLGSVFLRIKVDLKVYSWVEKKSVVPTILIPEI